MEPRTTYIVTTDKPQPKRPFPGVSLPKPFWQSFCAYVHLHIRFALSLLKVGSGHELAVQSALVYYSVYWSGLAC